MNLELKDILLISLGILGWIWAVVQYILTRKYQKRDKAIEKRFEIYSNFMNKADEISLNLRTDPKMVYGITNELYSKLLNGTEEETNQALIDYNSELIEFTKRSVQPLLILNQELNKLKLICSDDLLPKIEEYKKISNDFSDEFQIVLNNISSKNDIEITAKELNNIGHNKRAMLMADLWKEMELMMRNEIGYYKQK